MIDEVSIILGGLLDKTETIARSVRGSSLPSGGTQLLLVSGRLQLPRDYGLWGVVLGALRS